MRKIVDKHYQMVILLFTIDLSKAFDKVNHYALFVKLMKRYIPVCILSIIENLFPATVVLVSNRTIVGQTSLL